MLLDIHPTDQSCLTTTDSADWRFDSLSAKSKIDKHWAIPIAPNVSFLRENFVKREFTPAALVRITAILKPALPFTGTYPGVPMEHQRRALDAAHDKKTFFFAHAMGAGKSFTLLTLAKYLAENKGMQGLVIACPASIRTDVWKGQIEQWYPEASYFILEPGSYTRANKWAATGGFKILVVSMESLSNAGGNAMRTVAGFLESRNAGMAIDESSRIKDAKRKRTRNIIDLGGLAVWRWCLTGTKVTQGFEDLYAQYRFLDWRIIGHKSFYTFRNEYCRLGGFQNKKIIGYCNIQRLIDLIRPYTHEVRKEDANELPPKIYQTRHVESTSEQKLLYKQLATYMETSSDGDVLTVNMALDRNTRYQQIAGGNFPYQDDAGWHTRPLKANPKLLELLDVLADTDEKVIIWARFIPEIEAIQKALVSVYGSEAVVTYYGGTVDRSASVHAFQRGSARFMVANQQTAGMGLTLTAATMAVYYSNSFSYGDRTQSEDRCHRTGTTKSVIYIDLVSDLQIDLDIQTALTRKQSMASFISDKLAVKRQG